MATFSKWLNCPEGYTPLVRAWVCVVFFSLTLVGCVGGEAGEEDSEETAASTQTSPTTSEAEERVDVQGSDRSPGSVGSTQSGATNTASTSSAGAAPAKDSEELSASAGAASATDTAEQPAAAVELALAATQAAAMANNTVTADQWDAIVQDLQTRLSDSDQSAPSEEELSTLFFASLQTQILRRSPRVESCLRVQSL